jgi:acetolactate decarboxylase
MLLLLISFVSLFQQDSRASTYEVHHVGEMRKVMREGNLAGTIDLRQLANKPHLYALGPLENLRGEVTIWNGTPSISSIDQGKIRIRETLEHKACFLVYASVKEWKSIPFPETVTDEKTFEAWLGKIAAEQGIQVNRPFPFLIQDTPVKLQFHIVNKTDDSPHTPEKHEAIKVKFTLEKTACQMLGFHSDSHHGVFTHHDSNIHVHVITSNKQQSGHVESVQFSRQAKLLLPR